MGSNFIRRAAIPSSLLCYQDASHVSLHRTLLPDCSHVLWTSLHLMPCLQRMVTLYIHISRFLMLLCRPLPCSLLQRMGITTAVPPDRTLEYAQQYAAAAKDTAQQLSLPVVDLYGQLQEVQGWRDRWELHYC
jgi:hypothetical protein